MRVLKTSLLLTALFIGLATAPAHAQPINTKGANPAVVEVNPINDPIEPFNRAVFQFNYFVDSVLLKPVTTVYKAVLPQFAEDGVSNFLSNLLTPVKLLNEILQGDWYGADITVRRFFVNSTLGLGGLIDVASYHGLTPAEQADFGQTLGKWGAGHGFYLVLPIIGPSSGRDAVGRVGDIVADPINWALWNSDHEWLLWTRAGLTVIDTRARYGSTYDDIMKNATDPYVTFRSIYSQRRAYLVQDRVQRQSSDPYAAVERQ